MANRGAAFAADKNWLKTRKALLEQLRREVQSYLGREPNDVRASRLRLNKEFSRRWRVSNKTELLDAVECADIVYGGDFHAFNQAQKSHLRILRSLANDRPIVVLLECVASDRQRWLDRFLLGLVSIEDLPVRLRWSTDWGFPWENYRALFELAKKRSFALVAVGANKKPQLVNLKAREKAAAKLIFQSLKRRPQHLHYVIYGDLHLAPGNLPKAVRDCHTKQQVIRELLIHLNAEPIYFALAKKGLEQSVDVVKLAKNQYCILNAPPWVKWQSYLLFLEGRADVQDAVDPTDHVARFVRVAMRDLNLSTDSEIDVRDLAIFSGQSSQSLRSILFRLAARERTMAEALFKARRSFFAARRGTGYLAQMTVNHGSELAGLFIHAQLSHRNRALWNLPSDFLLLVWTEAVAFFVSKLMNHKRQSETIFDLRSELSTLTADQRKQEVLRLVLDFNMSELLLIHHGRRRPLQFIPRRKTSYVLASRILGSMLGERLYVAFRSRKLKTEELLQWLRLDLDEKNFSGRFDKIVRRIESMSASNVAVKVKRERL